MKSWATIASTLLLGLFAYSPAAAQSGEGWLQLFDGKTVPALDSVGPSANWRVENGELVADKLSADKGTNHLVTKDKYKDFQIHLEFWSDEKVNSGVFIRCQNPAQIGAKSCYEVNIFDGRKDPTYGTGAIVYFTEVNPMPKAAGKWNTMEITAKGRTITVMLNGQKTAELHNGMFEEGPFTLQYGSGVLKVRKLAVKRL
ncbi:MAG: DUF1080 domain-containing protein [Betaproteobacteria bacterium]|nr:DUF1080 domain-containing protein [Betaproteobacteria bacterium]